MNPKCPRCGALFRQAVNSFTGENETIGDRLKPGEIIVCTSCVTPLIITENKQTRPVSPKDGLDQDLSMLIRSIQTLIIDMKARRN